MQPLAQKVYDNIDRWWPYEPVKPADAPDMVSARNFRELLAGWPATFGRMPITDLPELPRGVIRPIMGMWVDDEAAMRQAPLNMLLYVDSVVLDATLLEPVYFVRQGSRPTEADFVASLTWLLTVRPLVEKGHILFADKVPTDLFAADELAAFVGDHRDARAIEAALPDGFMGAESAARVLAANVDAAMLGRATPIALARWQQMTYQAMLGQRRVRNLRESDLALLGRFRILHPQTSWASLVSLRENEEAYHHVREAIGRGFRLASDLSDDHEIADAQSIVHDELFQSFRHLEELADRSPFRTAFTPAAKALGWLGLGAVGSQLVGSPISAGKGSGSAVIDALAERAKAKAIWTVVTSFFDE